MVQCTRINGGNRLIWPLKETISGASSDQCHAEPSEAPAGLVSGPKEQTLRSAQGDNTRFWCFQRPFRLLIGAFAVLATILAGTSTALSEVRISAKVEPKKLSMYENATLEVLIESDDQNLPQPQLPPLTDFQVFSSGRSQSVKMVNGRVNASVTYRYVLAPRQTGRFVIGPATITVGGKVYSTATEAIIVSDGPAPQAPPTSQQGQDPKAPRGERDRRVFITGSVDKDTVYVNQPVTYTFRFYSGERLLSNPEYQRPAFTGFWVEDLPPQRKYTTTVNGATYEVTEIRTALFPAESGTKLIPAAEVNATVRSARRRPNTRANPFNLFDDSFFDRGETLRLTTDPLRLVVLPTPPTEITPPPSGLVGEFEIRAKSDMTQVNVGDPVTVSVTITGEGNVKAVPRPHRDTLPNFRMFTGGTSENITTANYRIRGSKTFDEVFVPQRAGTYSLPSFSLTYFNPKTRSYEVARTEPIEITVTGGAADFTIPTLRLEPDQLSDLAADVRFLKTDGSGLRGVSGPGLFGLPFWAGHLIPLLGLIGFFTWRRGVLREVADPVGRRRRLARSAALMRLRGRDPKAPTQPLTSSDLSEALMQFYSDRYDVSAHGQTRSEIRATLVKEGLSDETIRRYIDLLDLCDRGRYAPGGMDRVSEDTVRAAEMVIADMEARR